MKYVFQILLPVLIFSQTSYGQSSPICWGFVISELHIIPPNPLPGEEVEIGYKITTFSDASFENQSLQISGSDITISVCMGISGLGTSDVFTDTISLGILPANNYNLIFKGYGDYALPLCDNYSESADSAWIDTTFLVSITNDFPENSIEKEYSIFPNPTTSDLFLEFENNTNVSSIKILDCYGRLITIVNSEIFVVGQIKINTDELPAGIYFIEIICDNRNYAEKFVKRSLD